MDSDERTSTKLVEVAPYSRLAGIYDEVMSHVNYVGWAQFVGDILTEHGLALPDAEPPPRLLECACGTGSVAIHLSRKGYAVDAFDGSAQMIEIARSKARDMQHPPQWMVSSFADLEAEAEYNAGLCLYDSVNYLMHGSAVLDFFTRIKHALKPRGLFLFDVCTEHNSLTHFADGSVEECVGSGYYRRVMIYHQQRRIQENLFYIHPDKYGGEVYLERHLQQIFALADIRRYIAEAGLKLLEETDDITRRPPSTASKRVHFLAQKD
jgi:ubiquinone/menaquinone biosynthesis C-methylase UbiE